MLGGLAIPRTLVLDKEVRGWVRANAGAGGVRWFKVETADDRQEAKKALRGASAAQGGAAGASDKQSSDGDLAGKGGAKAAAGAASPCV